MIRRTSQIWAPDWSQIQATGQQWRTYFEANEDMLMHMVCMCGYFGLTYNDAMSLIGGLQNLLKYDEDSISLNTFRLLFDMYEVCKLLLLHV